MFRWWGSMGQIYVQMIRGGITLGGASCSLPARLGGNQDRQTVHGSHYAPAMGSIQSAVIWWLISPWVGLCVIVSLRVCLWFLVWLSVIVLRMCETAIVSLSFVKHLMESLFFVSEVDYFEKSSLQWKIWLLYLYTIQSKMSGVIYRWSVSIIMDGISDWSKAIQFVLLDIIPPL